MSRPLYEKLFLITLLMGLAAMSQAAPGWLDRLKNVLGGNDSETPALSQDDIAGGLKEALRVGTNSVVDRLGEPGGFNLDPAIHIPLPDALDRARAVLARVGMDSSLADLETRLNRAAEIATPKARTLFLDAIGELTLDDVMAIYNGPEDAATSYFRSKMAAPLAADMTPVVEQSLSEAGTVQTFNDIMDRYHAIPFAPKVDADLNSYVVSKGIDGIFFYLAREEAAIRADPAKRTTELLRRVFGQ